VVAAESALLVAAGLLVGATLLPLLRVPWWWVRSFDFPRLQILVLLVGVGVALAVVGGPVWALAAVAGAALYQSWRVWPYTPLARVQSLPATDSARTLRLVVSNVLMTNADHARWARVVRAEDPDVIAAVETDDAWVEALDAFADTHPHAVALPQDDTYGMAVRSRFEIVRHEVRHLVEPEVPSLWLALRLPAGDGADEDAGDETNAGDEVTLVVVHPRPPRPDTQQDATLRDAELVRVARALEPEAGPVIVAGDLNDVAWSDTTTLFQKLSGLLDPRIGRGLYATFHARHAWLRYPLDHVFHSEHWAVVDLARLADVGSDHFPMRLTLALDPQRQPQQDAPDADADDREDAAEAEDEAEDFLAEETPEEKAERTADDV